MAAKGVERDKIVADIDSRLSRFRQRLFDDAGYHRVQRFEGRMNGNIIGGMVRGAGPAPRAPWRWRAVRASL